MGPPKMKRLLRILFLVPVALVVNLLITIVFVYFVLVCDIYINTERLSRANPPLNVYCENIAHSPQFTKGPVIFRIDKGTLVFRLAPYFRDGIIGYAPFFIFPHHRTVILSDEVLKRGSLDVIVAHELGHIQGGLKHIGSAKEMEQYANNFAIQVLKTLEPQEPQK